jgi:methyl-accepting chemotaxis protein
MHDTFLVIFIGILAVAVLMQTVLLLRTFLYVRKMSESLLPTIHKVAKKAEIALEKVSEIADNIKPAAQKIADSADIVHNRVVEIDDFLGEVVEKSRQEIAEIQDTLHEVTQRAQEAVGTLSDNVLLPINRINALTRAVKVAAGVFFHRRGKAAASPQDDIRF